MSVGVHSEITRVGLPWLCFASCTAKDNNRCTIDFNNFNACPVCSYGNPSTSNAHATCSSTKYVSSSDWWLATIEELNSC